MPDDDLDGPRRIRPSMLYAVIVVLAVWVAAMWWLR